MSLLVWGVELRQRSPQEDQHTLRVLGAGRRASAAAARGVQEALVRLVRWGMSARDRQLMRHVPGPPVSMHFKELGVDQREDARCEGRLSADRIDGRQSTLAAGFAQRGQFDWRRRRWLHPG